MSPILTRARVAASIIRRCAIGCNADSHLLAAAWGGEIALRTELARTDMGSKVELAEALTRGLARKFAGLPPEELAQAIEQLPDSNHRGALHTIRKNALRAALTQQAGTLSTVPRTRRPIPSW